MTRHRKHSFFPGPGDDSVINRKIAVRREFFTEKDLMERLYEATWQEFAMDILAFLEQCRQPVVIETDFAEYVEDGMQVLHFKARYTPVAHRHVVLVKDIPLEIVHHEKIRTLWQRLKYVVTGKV